MRIFKLVDENLEEFLMIILLVLIVVVMSIQILMRFLLGALTWPEELARYCYVWTTFLSIPYCIRKGCALRIDLVLNKVSASARKLLFLVIEILSLLLIGYLFIGSLKVLKMSFDNIQFSVAMQIPMYFIYASVPFGLILAVLRNIQVILKYFTKVGTGGNNSKDFIEGGV